MGGPAHLRDDVLQRFTDHELDARRQKTVEAHLADCRVCRERLARLSAVADLFEVSDRSTDDDAEWLERAKDRLRHDLKRAAPSSRPLWIGHAGTATTAIGLASAAAAVFAAVLYLRAPALGPLVPPTPTPVTDAAMLPIVSLTPGATWDVTVEELCAAKAREQRPVSDAVRASVLHDYGMDRVPPAEYELDYLVTPDLGGAPDAKNLWPQRYGSTTWNPQVKDQLEHRLSHMVCAGTVALVTAQRDLATNWISAYRKYFKSDVPLDVQSAGDASTDPSGDEPLLYPVWRPSDASSLRLISFSPSRPF